MGACGAPPRRRKGFRGVTQQLSRQTLVALDDAFRSRLAAVVPAGVSLDEATAGIYSQLEGTINGRVIAGEDVPDVVREVAELVLSDV